MTIYLKEQDGKNVEINGAEFSEKGLNLTAEIDKYLRMMAADERSGCLFFKRGWEHCYLTLRGMEINATGIPTRFRVNLNDVKVCLQPNGLIELVKKSNNRLICNLGSEPVVEWRHYQIIH